MPYNHAPRITNPRFGLICDVADLTGWTGRSVACALVAGLVLVTAGCGGDDGGDEVSTTGATEPVTSVTTAPGEPVTVADVADLPDGTTVTVRAFVFQPDEGATVLCDILGESYPPTCVGPTLVTNGLDVNALPGLESTSGGRPRGPRHLDHGPGRGHRHPRRRRPPGQLTRHRHRQKRGLRPPRPRGGRC